MTKETKILVNYRVKRAEETLDDAKILFKSDKLFSCVNRIYYAMFYMVNALLLTRKLVSSKHSGVLSLFNKEFVNKGIIDKSYGKFYKDIFKNRQKGDYKDLIKFEEDDVKKWLSQAERFICEIKKYINKMEKSK